MLPSSGSRPSVQRTQTTNPVILDMGNTDYPLKIYMKELTDRLFQFTENLGLILYNYLKEKGKEELVLTAIAGLCIEEFNNFLGYK